MHVKIDTGMSRIGVAPEDAPEYIASLRKLGGIAVQGLMTHFADADLQDKYFASQQMDRFEMLLRDLDERKIEVPMRTRRTAQRCLISPRLLYHGKARFDALRLQSP